MRRLFRGSYNYSVNRGIIKVKCTFIDLQHYFFGKNRLFGIYKGGINDVHKGYFHGVIFKNQRVFGRCCAK